jgi:chemotaxis regulatin CheY-phosphate phosphatase CheZ
MMSGYLAHQQPSEADYDAIHAAVMETERGRWFLSEYAKRNRHADTDVLMTAIHRIERSIAVHQDPNEIDRFRMDVIEMSRAIARTHSEIAAIRPDTSSSGRITEVSDELSSIVTATEQATSDILAAAEWIQETAWTMRESGADARSCDELDEYATSIYTSCSFQDLTAQRTRKVMEALAFLENRITAMIDIWGFGDDSPPAASPTGPVSKANTDIDPAMSQADVDFVLIDDITDAATSKAAEKYAAATGSASAISARSAAEIASDLVSLEVEEQPELPVTSEMTTASEDYSPSIDPATMATLRSALAVPEADPSTDEFLFGDAPRSAHLQLVPDSSDISEALDKVRAGNELSADEAAKALDALKRMSIEDRTRIFT